jgi:hypothetical protein
MFPVPPLGFIAERVLADESVVTALGNALYAVFDRFPSSRVVCCPLRTVRRDYLAILLDRP